MIINCLLEFLKDNKTIFQLSNVLALYNMLTSVLSNFFYLEILVSLYIC